jgi:hypothetical protein
MKKTAAIILFAVTFLFGSPVFASQARRDALPGVSGFILDDGDIFSQPSLTTFYYRALVADLGADTASIAAKSSVLAVYANQEQTFGVVGLASNNSSPALNALKNYLDPCADSSYTANLVERLQDYGVAANLPLVPQPGREYDLIYARRLNDDWTAGIRVERASGRTSYSYTTVANDAASSATGITLAAGYEPSDQLRADLGVSYVNFSFQSNFSLTDLDSSQHLASDGMGCLSGCGRLFLNLNEDMVLVPAFKFSYFDLGYAYDKNFTLQVAGGGTEATGIHFGCGWQYRPDNKVTLLAGVWTGAEDSTAEDTLIYHLKKYDHSSWVTSLGLGIEYSLNGWLTARLGGCQNLVASSLSRTFMDDTELETKAYTEPYELGLGLGFRLRGFVMDVELNPKLLYSGGQLASGSKHWPVSRASLSFRY